MNRTSNDNVPDNGKKDEGMLERIAEAIDPSGADVTDDELIDPGANIRDTPPRQDEVSRKPPEQR